MRARLTFPAGLALLLALAPHANAQTSGGRGGDAGSIKCVNCIVYGDMIAGNGGRGGDALDGARPSRRSSDRQGNVGPGSKCITYNGRPYCD